MLRNHQLASVAAPDDHRVVRTVRPQNAIANVAGPSDQGRRMGDLRFSKLADVPRYHYGVVFERI